MQIFKFWGLQGVNFNFS